MLAVGGEEIEHMAPPVVHPEEPLSGSEKGRNALPPLLSGRHSKGMEINASFSVCRGCKKGGFFCLLR